MNVGERLVRLAVVPAQFLTLLASLPLMAAPFVLAWTVALRLQNGSWPPASLRDVLLWLHVWAPPGSGYVPLWLALGACGYLGLLAANWLSAACLRGLERVVLGPRA